MNTREPSLPNLLISRKKAEIKIIDRIEQGKELLERKIPSMVKAGKKFYQDYFAWSDYNSELLKRTFNNDTIQLEYKNSISPITIPKDMGIKLLFKIKDPDLIQNITSEIRNLESIINKLDLIPEVIHSIDIKKVNKDASMTTNKVFIVHGHDEQARETVARFVEKLGLEAIILHEQPNVGRTIIKKLEDYSNVRFAIVLLTPDDEGRCKDEAELKPRARQNVIFELGLFIGKLKTENVCALYKKDVEIPSDYQGVLYHPLDSGGGWKLALAKELKAADFNIDMNKVI